MANSVVANTDVLKTLNSIWNLARENPSVSLTLLAGGTSSSSWMGTGNISLKYPLSDFDAFMVVSCSDSKEHFAVHYYRYEVWKRALTVMKTGNKNATKFRLFEEGNETWWINPKTSTDSSLVLSSENAIMCAIYGVNFSK